MGCAILRITAQVCVCVCVELRFTGVWVPKQNCISVFVVSYPSLGYCGLDSMRYRDTISVMRLVWVADGRFIVVSML